MPFKKILTELDAPADARQFGQGWISGVLAFVLSLIGFASVLCFSYPDWLTFADARQQYAPYLGWIRSLLQLVLLAGFGLGIVSIVLRKQKILGFSAIVLAALATLLGGANAQSLSQTGQGWSVGLDWFLLNLVFTGLVFIPLERLFGRTQQPVFRMEWREDLLYFLLSSLFVQALSFLSLSPALAIAQHTDWAVLRQWVGAQPLLLQLLVIMFLTDFVQYWVHRLFHQIPFLWKFHAVHHSAQAMDWLAGSRMHFLEIVALRGYTLIPMMILGFSQSALYAYIAFVYVFATVVHANIRFNYYPIRYWFVTPLFHHWHHGIEKEAIDVNFAVHFPLLDKLFGTFYLPKDGHWPTGYGIKNHPVPKGFIAQFLYPFKR